MKKLILIFLIMIALPILLFGNESPISGDYDKTIVYNPKTIYGEEGDIDLFVNPVSLYSLLLDRDIASFTIPIKKGIYEGYGGYEWIDKLFIKNYRDVNISIDVYYDKNGNFKDGDDFLEQFVGGITAYKIDYGREIYPIIPFGIILKFDRRREEVLFYMNVEHLGFLNDTKRIRKLFFTTYDEEESAILNNDSRYPEYRQIAQMERVYYTKSEYKLGDVEDSNYTTLFFHIKKPTKKEIKKKQTPILFITAGRDFKYDDYDDNYPFYVAIKGEEAINEFFDSFNGNNITDRIAAKETTDE